MYRYIHNSYIYHKDNEKYSIDAAKFLVQCYLFNYMNITWIQPKLSTVVLMEN